MWRSTKKCRSGRDCPKKEFFGGFSPISTIVRSARVGPNWNVACATSWLVLRAEGQDLSKSSRPRSPDPRAGKHPPCPGGSPAGRPDPRPTAQSEPVADRCAKKKRFRAPGSLRGWRVDPAENLRSRRNARSSPPHEPGAPHLPPCPPPSPRRSVNFDARAGLIAPLFAQAPSFLGDRRRHGLGDWTSW
jgi:hypothetical protein